MFNQPLSGNDMPRCGGIATMMRLPFQSDAAGLDAAFVGIPFDIGTSNRPGTRLGPRQIRDESRMLRPYNVATFAAPFESLQVADIGDVPINTFNLLKSMDIIERFYTDTILAHGCTPLTLGGDHTIVLPILRAMAKKHGPVGLVHIDAHADINDEMFGEKIAHGTPFRRAMEEGLLDGNRVVQIGLRGTGYSADEFDWSRDQGFRVVPAAHAADGRSAPTTGRGSGVFQLRHRRHRPGLCAGHRHRRNRRPHRAAGAGNCARPAWHQFGGLRFGGSVAALRSFRQHFGAGGQFAV